MSYSVHQTRLGLVGFFLFLLVFGALESVIVCIHIPPFPPPADVIAHHHHHHHRLPCVGLVDGMCSFAVFDLGVCEVMETTIPCSKLPEP